MNTPIKSCLAGLALAMGLFGAAVAGPLDDGDAAFNRGDFASALQIWRPLADRGGAIAQHSLGVMYARGEGVTQDYVQAYKWLDLAASRIPPDQAANRELAVSRRDLAAALMTPAQVTEAQRLAREWVAR